MSNTTLHKLALRAAPWALPLGLLAAWQLAVASGLGDALILFSATFWTNSITGLAVLAGFVWVITNRFIKPEEERLAAAFGDRAAEWFTRVRRWI